MGGDNRKCETKTCGDTEGVKEDGTCAANRGECASPADYYFIDATDGKKCKIPTCTDPKGVKEDGTCAATRAACNGAGKASDYWAIDAADKRKCKQTSSCTPDTKYIHPDGTC